MLALHLFCAGDCGDYFGDLEPNFVEQLNAMKMALASGDGAATLSLDSTTNPNYWCMLSPAGERDRLQRVPPINSGSVTSIVDFLRWSRAQYPAHRSVYSLGGHGFAWDDTIIKKRFGTRGVAERATKALSRMDAGSGRRVYAGRRAWLKGISEERWAASRNLSRGEITVRGMMPDAGALDYLCDVEMKQLAYEIASDPSVGPPAVFVLDACSMSSIEVLGQLRGVADIVVASFDEEPAQGIPFDALLQRSQSLVDSEDIAGVLIGAFRARYGNLPASRGGFGPQHFSLVALKADAPRVDALTDRVAAFADLAIGVIGADATAAEAVRRAGRGATQLFNMRYIADFAMVMDAFSAVPKLASASQELARFVVGPDGPVWEKYLGDAYRACSGLSVFWPRHRLDIDTHRGEYEQLDFAQRTGWLDLVDALYPAA